ncbi:replication initiation protein, partial [Enterococcus faecalis]|uniref:replication initiation protein n=1 Tax=Enterococcus faecalis TaxID=1351 RepID=UPI0010C1A0A4
FYSVSIDEFKEIMDIRISYTQMGQIDQRVIKPAMKELNNYFENLELTKIKAKKRNKIPKLQFTYTGQKTNKPSKTMHDW